MNKRNVFLHVACLFVAGTVSIWLTYAGPGRTPLWAWNFGYISSTPSARWVYEGGYLECFRLVILIIGFVIVTVLFREHAARYWQGPPNPFAFYVNFWRSAGYARKALLLGVSLVVVGFIVGVAPGQIRKVFQKNIGGHPPYRDALVPYLTYLPYALVMYVGLLAPLLVPTYDALKADLKSIFARGERIKETQAHGVHSQEELDQQSESFVDSIHRLRGLYIRVVNKYIWLALCVTVYFLIESGGTLMLTLSCNAQEALKLGMWALLISAFSFAVVAFQSYSHYYMEGLRGFDHLSRKAGAESLSKEKLLANEDLFQKNSPISFMLALLKSTTLACLVLAGAIGMLFVYLKSSNIALAPLRMGYQRCVPGLVSVPTLKAWDALFPSDSQARYDEGCKTVNEKGNWKGLRPGTYGASGSAAADQEQAPPVSRPEGPGPAE